MREGNLIPVHSSQELGGYFISNKFPQFVAQGLLLFGQQGIVKHEFLLSWMKAKLK